MEGSMESTIVTSLVKTLKVIQRMEDNQHMLMTDIKDVRQTQKTNSETLTTVTDTLSQLTTKEELDNVLSEIKTMTTKLSEMETFKDTLMSIMSQNTDSLSTEIKKSTTDIQNDIASSNNQEIMKVIDSLVQGLSNMHKNMMKLAERVEALSKNVNSSIESTKDLSNTMIDSNARVKSMDMRMAALLETQTDTTEHDNSLKENIEFLKQFSSED